MIEKGVDIVVVGGSAGCIPVISELIEALPYPFNFRVVVVVHRSKNVISELEQILALKRKEIIIKEPDDKEPIQKNCVYLAPQNYHLLIEATHAFCLDYSEPVFYSRPSIDVTFESIAEVYTEKTVAILLSGANGDGAKGMAAIIAKGGTGIVQDPSTAEYPAMPQLALEYNPEAEALPPSRIVTFMQTLNL
ncbi:chemotaxis protein CheB [Runella slithyformis]|uniref:protein-glutamate methylesterase n=1 Tax=Runella slithyformis (strain ATCC 29530 / DSM 19594 / LMG 11500 / NCIMB 11436 / LSU 4) TaxID=761193 RepID=A0A7U3ZM65_RUNSL|nr:chemotaxis protein CheB [Runella slithyformis]AEI49759.1 CheB methylesterase [Runella slithyformis DSM 19594]